jgi:hypothetical protein
MPLSFLFILKSNIFKRMRTLETLLSALITPSKRINDKSQKNAEIIDKNTENAEKPEEIHYFLEFQVNF